MIVPLVNAGANGNTHVVPRRRGPSNLARPANDAQSDHGKQDSWSFDGVDVTST